MFMIIIKYALIGGLGSPPCLWSVVRFYAELVLVASFYDDLSNPLLFLGMKSEIFSNLNVFFRKKYAYFNFTNGNARKIVTKIKFLVPLHYKELFFFISQVFAFILHFLRDNLGLKHSERCTISVDTQ